MIYKMLIISLYMLSGIFSLALGANITSDADGANGVFSYGGNGGNITNAKGETVSTEVGTVAVSIDKSSTWTLTADTYIASFDGDISSVDTNGYILYVNGVAMN